MLARTRMPSRLEEDPAQPFTNSLLVRAHVHEHTLGFKHHRRGESAPPDHLILPGDVLNRAAEFADAETAGGAHPHGHGFAVQEPLAKPGGCFERMADGVSVVEHRSLPGIALIDGDDARLDRAAFAN